MKIIYLKSALKMRFFLCNYWYQYSIFRVSLTIEPGRSLLQFVQTVRLPRTVWLFVNNFFLIKFIQFSKLVATLGEKRERNIYIYIFFFSCLLWLFQNYLQNNITVQNVQLFSKAIRSSKHQVKIWVIF